ncbi:MAG: hypothetical protein AABW73_04425 [Nanoarchaeota archaeon]
MRKEILLAITLATILIMILVTQKINLVSAQNSNSVITGKAVTITGKAISGFSSFVDFVKSKISGRASSQSFNINISVPNTQPRVNFVATISDQSVTEAGQKTVAISFIVYDQDGYETINGANATITNSTGSIRYNQTCQKTNTIGTKEQNFTCGIGIWYFDNAGVWTITITATDQGNLEGTNSTTNFTILQTLGITTSPETITWATLTAGDKNKTAIQHIQINNTANTAVSAGNVSINATNLVGDTYSSYSIYAGNFSVAIHNTTNTSSCAQATSTRLVHYNYTTISGANLSVGNVSINDGRGQTKMYVCIRELGIEILEQNYTTSGEGPWIIKVQ